MGEDSTRSVQVFGPAYLDRVLRVDRPLLDRDQGPPLDMSVDGILGPGEGLTLLDPTGRSIVVEPPDGWPGPFGVVRLSRPLAEGESPWRRVVRGMAWHEDLGGMGAGFAAAFGGVLVSALGPEDDPISRAVAERLALAGIDARPVRLADQTADWTLLLTSGPFGDKLPIGFRGCHAALDSSGIRFEPPCDLRVVAALPNRLAASVLSGAGARVRFFAPAMRNMLDRDCPLAGFAREIDILCCNRGEWEVLNERETVAEAIPLLAITDGPLGSRVRFRNDRGRHSDVSCPAFPRSRPPRDTNRAGEAYASTLVSTLLDAGWTPGPTDEALIRHAALRASAAAALVLDREDFGFPDVPSIDAALRAGIVSERPGAAAGELR